VLAQAGKKVVLLEQGPDWQMSDLISPFPISGGGGLKTAGAPFLLEGKNPFGYSYQSGWGVGGAALHYFANFPRLLPNDFRSRASTSRPRLADLIRRRCAPITIRWRKTSASPAIANAEEPWRPAGKPYPMPPMKTFRHGEVWLKGFESVGIRTVPAAVG